jgi:hypothetical protein
MPVSIWGGKTNKKVSGFIYNDTWDTKFYYPKNDGSEELWLLKDLIVISSVEGNKFKSLTQAGDSGAFVVDKGNSVIGLVVGGDTSFTYAIKMNKIAATFNIELIQS